MCVRFFMQVELRQTSHAVRACSPCLQVSFHFRDALFLLHDHNYAFDASDAMLTL